MKLSIAGVLAVFVLALSGCANQGGGSGKSGQPDWIAGDSSKFPKGVYLSGRGSASSVDEAKRRAQADLSEIFEVNISATTESNLNVSTDSRDARGERITSDVNRKINTTTEQIISGIEVGEIWQNPATREFHVLAVLKRQPAAARLRQQIDELEQGVTANLNQAKSSGDLIVKITAMSKAIEGQVAVEGLQKSLRVVSASGHGADVMYNSGNLKVEMDNLLKQLRIAPKILDGSQDGLDEVVSGALSKAGFLVDTGSNPMFLLKASLKMADLGLIDGMYWQRGNLEISVSEAASGRVRGTQRWPIKTSARDRATAAKRAMDEADSTLKKELGSAIIGMATSTK